MELFSGSKIKPTPECQIKPGKHRGLVHEYDAKMVAELDGTPTPDAPEEKAYICEGHFPDRDDPKFLLCICALCKERKKGN